MSHKSLHIPGFLATSLREENKMAEIHLKDLQLHQKRDNKDLKIIGSCNRSENSKGNDIQSDIFETNKTSPPL